MKDFEMLEQIKNKLNDVYNNIFEYVLEHYIWFVPVVFPVLTTILFGSIGYFISTAIIILATLLLLKELNGNNVNSGAWIGIIMFVIYNFICWATFTAVSNILESLV